MQIILRRCIKSLYANHETYRDNDRDYRFIAMMTAKLFLDPDQEISDYHQDKLIGMCWRHGLLESLLKL